VLMPVKLSAASDFHKPQQISHVCLGKFGFDIETSVVVDQALSAKNR
jgi:hypothetical protein